METTIVNAKSLTQSSLEPERFWTWLYFRADVRKRVTDEFGRDLYLYSTETEMITRYGTPDGYAYASDITCVRARSHGNCEPSLTYLFTRVWILFTATTSIIKRNNNNNCRPPSRGRYPVENNIILSTRHRSPWLLRCNRVQWQRLSLSHVIHTYIGTN